MWAANTAFNVIGQFSLTSIAHRISELVRLKRGFQPTQRTQRKESNEMTSLFYRPITAASDDGVCRRHAAKLWQTHAIKYEIIEIKFDLRHNLYNK